MDASGNGWISDAIRCYDYCTRQDAHIVSNSWGVYSTSAALQAAAEVGAPALLSLHPSAALQADVLQVVRSKGGTAGGSAIGSM